MCEIENTDENTPILDNSIEFTFKYGHILPFLQTSEWNLLEIFQHCFGISEKWSCVGRCIFVIHNIVCRWEDEHTSSNNLWQWIMVPKKYFDFLKQNLILTYQFQKLRLNEPICVRVCVCVWTYLFWYLTANKHIHVTPLPSNLPFDTQ